MEPDPAKLGGWRYVDPFFNQSGTICLDRRIKWVFLGLLLMLQVMSIVWFGMIIKVALSMLKGDGASDTRSGDEDEESDEPGYLEEKSEEIRPTGKTSQSPSAMARTSGSEIPPRHSGLFRRGTGRIRVPGSRDRKELIGRVGCNG